MSNTPHQLPPMAEIAPITLQTMMEATLRLSDILSEETALLDRFRFGEIAAFQDEKLALTKLLETCKQQLAKDPGFVVQADPKLREEMILIADDLAFSIEENFRKLSAARAVNTRVMQAIMDVLSEQHCPGVYGKDGAATGSDDLALSLNLNQKA